ncbi:hypothetical protein GCM10011505_35470 [Tistrella bauzanensis]|uniref:Guanylate cyclase domain-containing protein n=1 Tax=Tistrella bauzanensis TaxID=657419 RepID=A0ABQ1IUC9_9PROT|nr:adenylate/guanylate cyclase domain-containing protein [Tistrella bauzanensis]GGB51300.1 hypothetical protein GCM10011505_35470 [Tistrella bauzanensis]
MTFSRRDRFRLRLLLMVVLIGVLDGGLYSFSYGVGFETQARGIISGLLIALPIGLWETWISQMAFGRFVRRQRAVITVAISSLIYLSAILFGIHTGAVMFHDDEAADGLMGVFSDESFAFAIAISLLMNMVFQLRRMMGPDVLMQFLTGRYHHPREEERAILFLDIRGSTAIAEQIGAIRFLDFLNRFYADLSEPILETGGQIYRYVGDEIIVTWDLDKVARTGGCFRLLQLAEAVIAERSLQYQQVFGAVPRWRAGLHCGVVAVGELGDIRQEIVLLGDAVNVTARLVDHARDTGEDAVASADLVERMAAAPLMPMRLLGAVDIRGRREPLRVYALGALPPNRTAKGIAADPARGGVSATA